MRSIESSSKYLRGRKRCKKRGLDLNILDSVINILATRSFTDSEIITYKVHNLSGKLRGYQELHVDGRSGNWLLVYKIVGNHVKFEDTCVVLENTGTHDECLGSSDINLFDLIFV
nr:MAG TPA: bacterial toxin [Caudoviricetes sp.]